MIFENKKLREILIEYIAVSKRLFDVSVESDTVYDLDHTTREFGMTCRLWNNTTYFNLELSNIDRITVSEKLNTIVMFINANDVIFGSAIPLGIVSLSKTRLFSAYGGNDKIAFSRICDVLFAIADSGFKDSIQFEGIDEGIYDRAMYIITALAIRFTAQKSKTFAKYASAKNIAKTLNSIVGIKDNDNFTHVNDVMAKLQTNSFMEIMVELFYENGFMNLMDEYQQNPAEKQPEANSNVYDVLKEKINQTIEQAKTTATALV